ncbi:MAG: hypothetical protein ACRECD_04265 [Burkholderiaceae bacterium]
MSATPKTPPRFVPTLTEVVQLPTQAVVDQPAVVLPSEPASGLVEEQIIRRVLQRLDVSLERRLREAVAAVVIEQTRSLGAQLREEIESALRQSVAEAVAEELAAHNAAQFAS